MKKKIKSIYAKIHNKIGKSFGYTEVNISSINYGEVLKGKKVLITGGGSGIGLAIAKKCLYEGASVVITGRNLLKLKAVKNDLGSSCLEVLEWDVSLVDEARKGIKLAESLLKGKIDILINNAGVISTTDFANVTEEIWDKIYATNSKGVFFISQAICDRWLVQRDTKNKKIINISSQGGFVGATYPYRMSKWDIAGLTQGLGIKMAPHGIIINGIAPGIILTDMQPQFSRKGENMYTSLNPIRRTAKPEEIAELALFLMSDASNFIVGQTIIADGGFTLK